MESLHKNVKKNPPQKHSEVHIYDLYSLYFSKQHSESDWNFPVSKHHKDDSTDFLDWVSDVTTLMLPYFK